MARVLVVDDRPADRELAALVLRHHGHEVSEAGFAREALEIVRGEPLDLVVTDLLMPEVDGYEFVYALRSDSGLPSLPVLFLSACYDERELRDLDIAYEGCRFLAKPFEPEALERAVRDAIELGPLPKAPPPELDELKVSRLRVLSAKLVRSFEEALADKAELDIRLRQQEAVAQLGQAALAGEGFARLSDIAVASLAETLDVELASLFELVSGGDEFVLSSGVGWRAGLVGAAKVSSGPASHFGKTLVSPDPVLVQNLRAAADEAASTVPAVFLEHEAESGMSVAILGHSRPFGVLGVCTRQRRDFTPHDAHFLSSIANVLATAFERRESEEEIARLAAVVDSSSEAIVGTSLDGAVVSWNPAAEQIYGYSAEEMLGRPIAALVPPDRSDELRRIYEAVVRGKPVDCFETVRTQKDGRPIEVEVTISPVKDGDGQVVATAAFARDISERKRLEGQLRQAQKMEAVGRLAGGISHDFNNLLTVVTGYSELVLSRLDERDPLRLEVEEIRHAADRGCSLTRQLLAFSRQQVLQPRVLDLNAVVGGVEPMLRRLIGEDVRLVTRLDPGLGHVRADPNQLEQVLLNLALNARNAMPEGGTLTAETRNVQFDHAYVDRRRSVSIEPGRYVMLSVSDTGIGMDAETLARAFEPFFTTREIGQGTGLGLSTVYGIVKQSGGLVWAYSEPGQGATFKVYLPLVEAPVEDDERPSRNDGPTQGSETVLLVEDDDAVRSLVREILETNGYTVVEAGGGPEALEVCELHEGGIDLLLTDLVMRGMNGLELGRRVVSLRPDAKTLCMSGYSEKVLAVEDLAGLSAGFIEKPFSPVALLEKIRLALDAAHEQVVQAPAPVKRTRDRERQL